eukprot:GHVS01094751.1.p1 GENE.GHVS01094751.1~~GHVS01094751.1.p1  ORF type:complete len:123 (+),score=18.93 GHVS01094751.1:236-604(+)
MNLLKAFSSQQQTLICLSTEDTNVPTPTTTVSTEHGGSSDVGNVSYCRAAVRQRPSCCGTYQGRGVGIRRLPGLSEGELIFGPGGVLNYCCSFSIYVVCFVSKQPIVVGCVFVFSAKNPCIK